MSSERELGELHGCIVHEETIKITTALDAIWDEIGLDDTTRKYRKQMFQKHVQDLYSDMFAEAEANRNELAEKVENLLEELTCLSTDLGLNITFPDEDAALFKVKGQLESQLQRYQKIHGERIAMIQHLQLREKYLCKLLGKQCRNIPTSPLASEEELRNFKIYLEELSDQKFQNEEIFIRKKSSIIDIMNELKIEPSLEFERKIVYGDDTDFLVTDENMVMLEQLHVSLLNQLEETRAKIAEFRESVSNLWELLEESPEVRSQFLNAHPGNSVDTLRALKMEIARCKEKKKENIRLFVDKMRQELTALWDKCRFSPSQRAEFVHFQSDCYTEDLLSLHEIQIDKVKAYYEKNKDIYELITKREQLWEKMIDLEQRANQPNRYQNRGGQLLREEKERKIIASKLPKVEQEIMVLVAKYEAESGTNFLINGKNMIDIIESAWEQHKENKHVTLSARKHARDNTRPLTPCKSRLGASRLQLPQTPVSQLSGSKRKVNTPYSINSKRPRCDLKILSSAPPKLLVNGSSIRRVSTERRRRIEKTMRRSKSQVNNDNTVGTTISDYDGFKRELQLKPTCRSSLFPEKSNCTVTCNTLLSTPSKTFKGLTLPTNTITRTPSRLQNHGKSPISTPKLATASGILPIII